MTTQGRGLLWQRNGVLLVSTHPWMSRSAKTFANVRSVMSTSYLGELHPPGRMILTGKKSIARTVGIFSDARTIKERRGFGGSKALRSPFSYGKGGKNRE